MGLLKFMDDDQIEALRQEAKNGNVYWRNSDGMCILVLGVKLNWVEFADQPTLTEPAAMLYQSAPVALYNETPTAFIICTPLFAEA